MCDMFGAKCFDKIMSNETYYKKCSGKCLEDCMGTTYVAVPSYVPIDTEICSLEGMFKMYLWYIIDHGGYRYKDFEYLTTGEYISNEDYCKDFVQKYISIVTVETPTTRILVSKRVERITFSQQLAVIGGTVGLFTGMSILSMIELLSFCYKIIKKSCLHAKYNLCKEKRSGESWR